MRSPCICVPARRLSDSLFLSGMAKMYLRSSFLVLSSLSMMSS